MTETRRLAPSAPPSAETASAADEGCLEILADRLRERPGVVAIEADFHGQHAHGALRAHARSRRTSSTRSPTTSGAVVRAARHHVRAARDARCLRRVRAALAHLPPGERDLYAISSRDARTRRPVAPRHALGQRRGRASATADKPWGAAMTPAEEEHYAEGRADGVADGRLPGAAAGGARAGAGRSCPVAWHHAAYIASAVMGGWFAARSTFAGAGAASSSTSTCS